MAPSLLSQWDRLVRARPGAAALIDAAAGRTWSRRELDALGGAWAGRAPAGLAGRAVAFAAPNGAAWWEVFLGLLKAGAVAAPLDAGEPAEGRLRAAESAGASWVWHAGQLDALPARRPRRDGRRLLKLTSGSTGAPRALAFTDAQMLADGRQICAGMGIRPTDLNLGLIPFGHSYGLGNLVVPLLAQGTPMVCADSALPQAVAAVVARWRPTVFPAVPALLRALAEAAVDPAQLRSLRLIISAGAPLDPAIAAAFFARYGRDIHNFYGSSETGGIAYDRTGRAAREGGGVGTALPGVRLSLGRGGRLSVASAAVFTLGNRPAGRGTGRHRPADRARLGARGELHLLGRVGRLAKIAGRRLNLAEIEGALRAIPGVRDAFVTLHAERSDALAAAVAGTAGTAAIRVDLRRRLASWKIPRKVVVLEEFPLTARGKTDTRRLASLLR